MPGPRTRNLRPTAPEVPGSRRRRSHTGVSPTHQFSVPCVRTDATPDPVAPGARVRHDLPMPYAAFISHSSQDREVADAIVGAIEAAGITCWIAPRDVPAAAPYAGAIVQAIRQCRVFVLVLTADAVESHQVLREVQQASEGGVPILEFRFQGVVPKDDLDYYLSPNHRLEWTIPVEAHVPELVEAARKLVVASGERPAPETPSTQPSPPWFTLAIRTRRLSCSFALVLLIIATTVIICITFWPETHHGGVFPDSIRPAPHVPWAAKGYDPPLPLDDTWAEEDPAFNQFNQLVPLARPELAERAYIVGSQALASTDTSPGPHIRVAPFGGILGSPPPSDDPPLLHRWPPDRETRIDWAIELFTKAIELKPSFAMAYANRGRARLFKGQVNEAIADFEKALALEPRLNLYVNSELEEARAKVKLPENVFAPDRD
jgi:hypothetical protein